MRDEGKEEGNEKDAKKLFSADKLMKSSPVKCHV
jgi:hypothetical protein